MPQNLSKDEFIALQNLSKNKDLIIQKSDKGNSMVTVDRQDYTKNTDNILCDHKKFTKLNLKGDNLLNFAVNQEKHVDEVPKNLAESNTMTEKIRKLLKLVGSRPGAMFGSCKEHKASIENCLPFQPILLALNIPTYKTFGANFKTFHNI